ncbi:MAG: nucleoside 2-deoxyribosyltransferase [Candidatus Promineifilaceae bacterium]|nr:nucleoside 2-deoxyribosyltransferase [Candidatus Promineifilaceae bacterium]
MRAYIAGPLFNPGERWFDEQIEACAAQAGLETFLPQRDTLALLPPKPSYEMVFDADMQGLDGAEMVIANLNGITTDPGTAWEVGYAYAKGKHVIGILTDMRLTAIHTGRGTGRGGQGLMFENQIANAMVQFALDKVVFSLEELAHYLDDYLQT